MFKITFIISKASLFNSPFGSFGFKEKKSTSPRLKFAISSFSNFSPDLTWVIIILVSKFVLRVLKISIASSADKINSLSIIIAIPSKDASSSLVVILIGLNLPKNDFETTQ